jgi:hypothetical protein
MASHLIDGEFQSDKYPTCPRGKVPLSTQDKTAQDLLWEYAQRRRLVDAEFSDDLEAALKTQGFNPTDHENLVLSLSSRLGSSYAKNEALSTRHQAALQGIMNFIVDLSQKPECQGAAATHALFECAKYVRSLDGRITQNEKP